MKELASCASVCKVSPQFRGLCLMREDFTMPRNPIVTRIFREIKLAENAGSGFDKMINGWKTYNEDLLVVSGGVDYYKITFPLVKGTETREKTSEKIVDTTLVTPQVRKILEACNKQRSREEIKQILGSSDREHLRKAYLRPALEAGWLTMTIPQKPKSRMQRYLITEEGKKALEGVE